MRAVAAFVRRTGFYRFSGAVVNMSQQKTKARHFWRASFRLMAGVEVQLCDLQSDGGRSKFVPRKTGHGHGSPPKIVLQQDLFWPDSPASTKSFYRTNCGSGVNMSREFPRGR
jgi:hypothetical protein